MFTAEQYRAKAIENSKLARIANGPDELREFEKLERSFAELADNAQLVTETQDQTMRAREPAAGPSRPGGASTMRRRTNGLHKPKVLLAGAFADRLLSTIEQRFAVRVAGDEFVDLDSVDFTNVSFAILFGYGHRIAERHLNKTVFINLHGSLLPLGRGPHPHIWNWINGDPHGVTIHKVSAEIDKGPIIVQRRVELKPWEHSINSTMCALADSATELFRENWNDIAEGAFALKDTDPRLGSSHRLKDTQQIRDIVNRFANVPVPLFLREVKTRMAVSSSR
jgi:Formyl transferase